MRKLVFILITLLGSTMAGVAFAGTVSGKVSFTGTPPTPQPIDMNADPSCASDQTGEVFTEDVLVDGAGGLANVFVYVKEGLEGQTFETPKEKVVLDQAGCRYTPRVFGLRVGQTLEILNSDATLHNVHGMPKKSKEFNLGMPIKGMKLKRKFDTPEIGIKFKCDVHPWMSAYAGVVEHPFFGVSTAEGAFQIQELPAGTYVLEAWHEKYGTQTQEVTVGDSGEVNVDFTFAG